MALPELPVDNALMLRIFRPDEEAPTRCSFVNCNAPLDRCMSKARSVDIQVGASYLNALVECTSFYPPFTIRHSCLDQQNHPDADWPFRAVETCTFRMPPFPPAQNARSVFAIVDHMPFVTSLTVLGELAQPQCNCKVADDESSLHRGLSANRPRTNT